MGLNKDITISVCIPTFNSFAKFRECIESVLCQEFENFEILVGDDSTDEMEAKSIEYFCIEHDVAYCRNLDSTGPASNWNRLITRANGTYIKFLHHDDKFRNSKSLRTFYNAIETQNQCSIIFSSSNLCIGLESINYTVVDNETCDRTNRSPSLLFSKNLFGAPSACIFKKLDGLRFREDFRWLVDLEFYYKCLNFGEIGCVEQVLVDIDVRKVGRLTSFVENDGVLNIREHFEFAKSFKVQDLHPRIFLRLAKVYLRFKIQAFWVLTKSMFREK
jgi:glycosyltransferase involved in cell wall biosynthesis